MPDFVIGSIGKRRIRQLLNLFPDAIDLMVRALRSGLPISEAIVGAAEEIGDPVGVEFSTIESGMRMGRDLDSLLWDIAKRIDSPELRFFIIALSEQRETGGNLAETLANLSDLLRRRRLMQQKVRAMSSEADPRVVAVCRDADPAHVLADLHQDTVYRSARHDARRDRCRDAGHRDRHHGQDSEVRDLTMPAGATPFDTYLPFRLGLNDIIAATAGLAALATCFAVWQALRTNNSFERRLSQIADKKAAMRLAPLATRRQHPQLTPENIIRELVTRLNLLRSHHVY